MLEWLVFLVSIIPFIELRGAIPLSVMAGHNPEFAFVVCVMLNLLAIPIAFILLDFILPSIRRRTKLVERMFKWSVRRAQKHRNLSLVGLTLFVGIPLPVTGAYTGSLIAYISGLNRKYAALAIATGVVIAGVLIWVLATLGVIFVQGLSPP
ncbi:MAG TPA: ligand-binding protein SH3 [Hadesarchaea archaeon]|nr:ligand-binding protein SH3 [Hadesarchaea archaeon]